MKSVSSVDRRPGLLGPRLRICRMCGESRGDRGSDACEDGSTGRNRLASEPMSCDDLAATAESMCVLVSAAGGFSFPPCNSNSILRFQHSHQDAYFARRSSRRRQWACGPRACVCRLPRTWLKSRPLNLHLHLAAHSSDGPRRPCHDGGLVNGVLDWRRQRGRAVPLGL